MKQTTLPTTDAVQTEGGLARGCEQRVLHGPAVFRVFGSDIGRYNVGEPQAFGREDGGHDEGRIFFY